jgi:hypothetical protein
MKRCPNCKRTLPLSKFHKDCYAPDGVQGYLRGNVRIAVNARPGRHHIRVLGTLERVADDANVTPLTELPFLHPLLTAFPLLCNSQFCGILRLA